MLVIVYVHACMQHMALTIVHRPGRQLASSPWLAEGRVLALIIVAHQESTLLAVGGCRKRWKTRACRCGLSVGHECESPRLGERVRRRRDGRRHRVGHRDCGCDRCCGAGGVHGDPCARSGRHDKSMSWRNGCCRGQRRDGGHQGHDLLAVHD